MKSGSCSQRRTGRVCLVRWLTLPLLTVCLGCPVTPPPSGGPPVIDPGTNKSIATAAPLDLSSGQLQFLATIHSGTDINVFQLGALVAGDHVHADIQTQTGSLDGVAAIFDATAELVDFNDDRDPNDVNPLIDFVLRGNPGAYYLAVIGFPGSNTTGEYLADVQIERQVGVPPPENQIVFLDWRGGNGITIPSVGTFNLPPFTARQVGFPDGLSATMKDRVTQYAQSRYAGLNITYLSSDHSAVPATPHSTVYFGGFSAQAFAVSQDIDSYNEDHTDSSIVFTESFPGSFTHAPSFDEMVTALGNTVAHETGHLLGLIHTADCADMMDTTCTNDRILQPQQFSSAPLDASVFPFGLQPEPDLLSWILGLLG